MDEYSDSKFDSVCSNLYERILKETKRYLKAQLEKLGVDDYIAQYCEKIYYPQDPTALCVYTYKGQKILGVRFSESRMFVEFDIPNLKES
jgi:hypothetical protein